MIEPMPNVRLGILRALRSKLNSEIQTYDMNLEILLGHSVGIGEHYRANLMKHTLPEEELYWWCKNIVTNKENV